jgi:two-component system phosphate regulon sensor histidine kinase PhoR
MEENIYWKIFFSNVAVLVIGIIILVLAHFSILSFTVILIMLFIFSTALTSFFIHNIDRLSDVIYDISKGEYKSAFQKRSSSEFRRIEDAISELQERLSSTIGALSESQNKLKAILSSMTEGVVAVDNKENIILFNGAAENLLSLKEKDVMGRNFIERIRQPEIVGAIRSAISGGSSTEKQAVIPLPQKKYLLVAVNRMEGGGAVAVLNDITRMKQLEELRSEFTANVSHELKTPLTAIKASAETLLEGAIDDKENNIKFIRQISRHAERLSSLIDDILELSSLEEKKRPENAKAVEILSIIDQAVESLSAKIREKKISTSVELHSGSLKVICDQEQILRVFINLLDNAVKYNNSGGSIKVTSAVAGENMRFSVEDTGIGIEEKYLPRIFERFYTVDRARSREMGGTGLGLAIAKHIVELNGGQISVSSRPGKGSIFSFTLKKA